MSQEFQSTGDAQEVASSLLAKIADRSAVIGVVGLGYVGLPLAVAKANAGFYVIGVDNNPAHIASIIAGQSYIPDIASEDLARHVDDGRIQALTDFSRVAEMDIIIICVPTPLTKHLVPDLTFVETVCHGIAEHLRPGQLVSLESTTYPGTTEEIMRPILEGSGLQADKDFFLSYSPERIDPGNPDFDTKSTNKVVGAVGPVSLQVASALYEQTIDHVVTVSSAQAAEMVKVYENTFRSVNIALVNEMALLCHRMGLDVWEVLDAAFTKPFGIMPFYPGPGVGGHCIPVDPHYLEWKAKEYGYDTRFIALAGAINRGMPDVVCQRIEELLNQKGTSVSRAKILLHGIAYKKDLGDFRGSPSLDVYANLKKRGATLQYHDPFVPSMRAFPGHGIDADSVELNATTVRDVDIVVILTNHSSTDYEWLADQADLVFDTRNVMPERDHVVRL